MNAALNEAEPPGVVITTATAPAACAGVVTSTEVEVANVMELEVPPKVTAVAAERFVPERVTVVPPAVLPLTVPSEARVGGS